MFHLPDLVVYRICDFLDCKSLINLKDFDWRVKHYHDIRANAVRIIIRYWRSFKMCGRVYLDCNLTRLNIFIQIGYMPLRYRNHDFNHHAVFPRNKMVIPRFLFRNSSKIGYHVIVPKIGDLMNEICTYPRVPVDLYFNDILFENITPNAVIPIRIANKVIIKLKDGHPKPSYICYTEIFTGKELDYQRLFFNLFDPKKFGSRLYYEKDIEEPPDMNS